MEATKSGSMPSQSLNLSLSQREVWLDQRAWPDSSHLNIGGGAYLKGPLDLACFKASLNLLVAENEALRLAPSIDGKQSLLSHYEPVLELVDLSSSTDPQAAMRAWWQDRIQEPFVLNGRPPWRFALLRASEQLHGLSIQFHHLVMDGWGTSLVMQRWSEIYNAFNAGTVPHTSSHPSYTQFIDESNAYIHSEAFERDANYWRTHLDRLPQPLVVRRYVRSRPQQQQLPNSKLAVHRIARNEYANLEAHANALGFTAFNFFLAALAVYFAKTNNCQEVVVGIPSLNRSGRRYRSTLGMFVGVSVLKLVVTEGMTVTELLQATNTSIRGALRHSRYPLSELGKNLQLIRSGRDGLFDVLLSFERQDYTVAFGAAQLVDSRQIFSGTARYPLGVTVCEFHPDQDLELVLDASSEYFASGEPALLGRRLWHLVTSFVSSPDTSLREILPLPQEESWALIHGLHGDIAFHELTQTYISQFEHQAALRPEATALVWDGGSMDYAELDRRATQLAHRLRSQGAVIALAIGRSPAMVVTLLAVAKACAAFLPLDMEAPVARLEQILQESNASALLIESSNQARFSPLHANILVIDAITDAVDVNGAYQKQEISKPGPRDLAYVLFTSGSTGRPKGVMVEHATLSRRLAWLSRAYEVDWQDRSAQATQFTFDPSLIELFLPLIHGGSIALPPPGRLLPEALANFAISHGVTIMAFVPSTLSRFLDGASGKTGLKLRVACCGGEVLPAPLVNRFLTETDARLYNVYGPTEAAIFASAWQCEKCRDDAVLPIGRPIDDTRIYVLSSQLFPMPFGVTGEIYIGGSALARGYLNRADLDAEAFLDDPFEDSGARMYRTGDLGWLDVDGNLHFSGRIDRQIKLRGYRIELGEIEAACLMQKGVTLAAAKLVQIHGRAVIHLWVAAGDRVDSQRVQCALRQRLPDYMIPSEIGVFRSLPETSVGKIDYEALPRLEKIFAVVEPRLPTSKLERDLLELWETVLQAPSVGVRDDFFDLGGDSLAAISILTGIEKLLGRRVPMYLLVEHPTIEQLAGALGKDIDIPEILIDLHSGGGTVPLYVAASGHGDLLRFQNLARVLGNSFDVQMLQPPANKVIKTVPDLAEIYAAVIAAQGSGPGFIAGFSIGGVAALETVRQLRKNGVPVRGLILIDTIYPKGAFGGALSWRMLGWIVRNLHVQELSMNGRRLGAMFNDPGLVGQVMALSGYRPFGVEGPTWLIKSSGLASWDRWFFRPWRKLMPTQLDEIQVPGLHGSIFETGNVDALAMAITSALTKHHAKNI